MRHSSNFSFAKKYHWFQKPSGSRTIHWTCWHRHCTLRSSKKPQIQTKITQWPHKSSRALKQSVPKSTSSSLFSWNLY